MRALRTQSERHSAAMQKRPEKQWEALKNDIDPHGTHGTAKVWAALKHCGLEPDDVEPGFADKGVDVADKVPKEHKDEISKQRRNIREGLRQQRLQKVREVLQSITDDDVRRLERCSPGGVRPLRDGDLPAVDEIDGVAEILEQMEKKMEIVKKNQERKAMAICKDFLMGKKRAEDADANIKALDARVKAQVKERDDGWALKKAGLNKAEENRKAKVAKNKDERGEYEDDVQEKADERLRKARATRAQTYSPENVAKKNEASASKREAAFQNAVEFQERTQDRIEQHAAEVEERLYQNRTERAEYLENRRQESHRKFVEKQIAVQAQQQEWCENRAKSHEEFTDNFKKARENQKSFLKDRAKSTGDILNKARDKWKSNHDRLLSENSNRDVDLMAKLKAAEEKVEHQLKPLKLKCGGDVFSHIEVKEKTFGDLVSRRRVELKNAQDAKTQALLIKLGERGARDSAKDQSQLDLKKRHVEAAKETLRYSNEATAVFQKIQSEPNEDRIRKAMGGLGFKMPRVGGSADDEGGGDA